jgi:hypothetical protein
MAWRGSLAIRRQGRFVNSLSEGSGFINGYSHSGVNDGHFDFTGLSCVTKGLSSFDDGHTVTNGPNLVAGGSELNEAA